MAIRIRRYLLADEAGVHRLNARLERGGITDRVYPESPSQPSEERGDPITQELYVAADGDEIRGGVWLHEHQFMRRGEIVRAGWLKYPVAESLINREHGGVPAAMLIAVMRRQPRLMALGMGSRDTPFASMLAGLGWRLDVVPFYVAPIHARRVFRELPHLRRSPRIHRIARIAARTGLATVAGGALSIVRGATSMVALRRVEVRVTPDFGAWADAIWSRHKDAYGFVARRDARMLNAFYPADFQGLTRLRVTRRGQDIGWVIVTISEPARDAAFGNLRVGLLADAFGDPADARTLLAAGTAFLVQSGADLVVTNQLHPAWRRPMRALGFLPGPSNVLLASSKPVASMLETELAAANLYINRGDCDGPRRW